jgi:hypothetical protein
MREQRASPFNSVSCTAFLQRPPERGAVTIFEDKMLVLKNSQCAWGSELHESARCEELWSSVGKGM